MIRTTAATLAVLLVLAVASLGSADSANAVTRVAFADQNPGSFSHPFFRGLGIKRSRVLTPWNVASKPRDRALLSAWLAAARAARVEPLVHFSVATGSRCPSRPCTLPSVRTFRSAFRAFRRRYPSVRIIGVWNEANHRSQPTFRNPRRAAQFSNVVRANCRRCTIVAADVIDETNMVRWYRVFARYATGERIIGLHNYRDTNPRRGQRFGGTRRAVRMVGRKQLWVTETGGIVKFILPSGATLFPFSESRQVTATNRMFSLSRRYSRRIKRLYIYHWQAPLPSNRFDAGYVRDDGTARPALGIVRQQLATSLFAP
jgi:hypothetical protein